ncbi:MAG: hypothetical protein QNK04_07340 [Myxococcota bacterium]|nr:hypothetical protein [Myxococcota bacterium]
MQMCSCFVAVAATLLLVPCIAAAQPTAKRSPWDADEVTALGSRLVEQAKRLEGGLRAASKAAEAAAAQDPDREPGVGLRAVVIADLGILQSRANAYIGAVEGGLGREETRSLFGRIESLMRLTASDVRRLPDYASYRSDLEALQETVGAMGLFYAEELEVETPPDPQRRFRSEP